MSKSVDNSILVVDDEAANHTFLTHLLSPEYTVFVAKNGQSAIKIARSVSPDLILLDILMPGMNGYDVFGALKSFDETRDIPVIFITGLNSNEDEKKGLAMEAVDYISKPFDKDIVRLRVRNHIKIVNQIRTINQLSSTDPLTHLLNRRGFEPLLFREWGRSIREKLPVSVMLLDADRFKEYNDTYGHQQGDTALVEVANSITQSCGRSTDYSARWGGEEFIVLLPNTEPAGALEVAERIRANIEAMAIPLLCGGETKITVSIGVNTIVPSLGDKIDDFIDAADKSLYKAKESGRNRVCHYSENCVIC